jgi:hypothetical protein
MGGFDEDGNVIGGAQEEEVAVAEEEVDIDYLAAGAGGEEEAEEAFDESKYDIIQPMYVQARALFLNPDVAPARDVELKWTPPEEEKLTAFLVEKMGFNAERVAAGVKKLVEAQGKKQQQRMDSFFSAAPQDDAARKRKLEMANAASKKAKAGAPKGKGSFGAKRR